MTDSLPSLCVSQQGPPCPSQFLQASCPQPWTAGANVEADSWFPNHSRNLSEPLPHLLILDPPHPHPHAQRLLGVSRGTTLHTHHGVLWPP